MIKIENTKVEGWEATIRGMRNPKNSWEKSDSLFYNHKNEFIYNIVGDRLFEDTSLCSAWNYSGPDEKRDLYSWAIDAWDGIDQLSEDEFIIFNRIGIPTIGPNDLKLMKSLVAGGPVHAKFRRFISVTMDLTAPFYWWNDFDTYRIGRCDANGAESFWGHDIEYDSCSTMHKIQAKEFTMDDFSHEHLIGIIEMNAMSNDERPSLTLDFGDENLIETCPAGVLKETIYMLNRCRELYLKTKDKKYWWQMIQLLPNSYHQMRTVKLNYEVLAGLYSMRKDHKQDEFRQLCKWIETLPYAKELIVGEEVKDTEEQLRARFKSYEDHIRYLEKALCKELHIAGMSIPDISERMSMAESTVRHFIGEGELVHARAIHGETVIKDADTGEQRVLKYTIGDE